MDIFYDGMLPADLEAMRIHWCVRRTEDINMMVMDECCGILKDYLKKISSSENINSLVNKLMVYL